MRWSEPSVYRKEIDSVKQRICILILAACLLSGMASAAPSFLGTTGLIFVPNDVLLKASDFSADFHTLDLGNNPTVLGVNIGVTESLELGLARFDSDLPGDSISTIINGKYSILTESVARPSLTIGVVDAGGDLDVDGDPGFYVVLGKNLTPAATGLSGEPVPPLRGYLGIGTGIYGGLFAAVEYSFSPRATLMAEFIDGLSIKHAISEDSVFNAGIRFAITSGLRADVALINGEDLGFGISYTKLGM